MSHSVRRTFRIEIGHRTWAHDMRTIRGNEFYDLQLIANKCANLHGHTIFVSITMCGESLDDQNILMDTHVLDSAFRPILDEVDHAFIVDEKDPLYGDIYALAEKGGLKLHTVNFSPTFEALARYFYVSLQSVLQERQLDKCVRIKEVRLLGEQTAEATYSSE